MGVTVGVMDGVGVMVGVGVIEGVKLGVNVAVGVGVMDGVGVMVGVEVLDVVGVMVGDRFGVALGVRGDRGVAVRVAGLGGGVSVAGAVAPVPTAVGVLGDVTIGGPDRRERIPQRRSSPTRMSMLVRRVGRMAPGVVARAPKARTTADSGTHIAPSRQTNTALPRRISSPSAKRCRVMRWPLTSVPLVLPRSRKKNTPFSSSTAQWRRETVGSFAKEMSLSGPRPMKVTGPAGRTDCVVMLLPPVRGPWGWRRGNRRRVTIVPIEILLPRIVRLVRFRHLVVGVDLQAKGVPT